MHQPEAVELVNMCMIFDPQTQQVVVEDKGNVPWRRGHAFPGGHVEPGEAIAAAMVREVAEETGLQVHQLEFCGTCEWFAEETQQRKIGFLFRTSDFTGSLKSGSREGATYWFPLAELTAENTAESMMTLLEVFQQPLVTDAVATTMNGPLTALKDFN